MPTLETARLRLRPFVLADAPAVQRLAGAPAVAATTLLIPHPYPDGAAETWIATHADRWADGTDLVLAITDRATGDLLGAIGLVLTRAHDRAELGYWIGVPFWNRGYASEAARAVVAHAFTALGCNRVQAHHFAGNDASGRVLLKAGLRYEGTSPQAIKKGGRFVDAVFYGATRDTWPPPPAPAP